MTDSHRVDRVPAGSDAASTQDDVSARARAEVRAGLSRVQKEIPPTYFYDRRGSELFEEITKLPEYYLTRAERALLQRWVPQWIPELCPRTVVELGPGAGEKTRIILDAVASRVGRAVYVPVDVSAEFLADMAARLAAEYDDITVRPAVADMRSALPLPEPLPRPWLVAFLGSTIGNFDTPAATRLLARIRERMCPGDHLLMGVDLRKDPAVLHAAYNDARGVTAEFNRNALRVLNAMLGADFAPDRFVHRAVYVEPAHRIEMHLVSETPQRVTIPDIGTITLRAGESIRTEISCKYDEAEVRRLASAAGLQLARWTPDDAGMFALALMRRAP
ncbi:MAG TPA: L-histidine N(alpha)-methyltransferase [Gemmatimonadaceae bacterium]|nr:L-histidine N(alpha)-methyltransferase [Gemmatimonadaceae bacterium]